MLATTKVQKLAHLCPSGTSQSASSVCINHTKQYPGVAVYSNDIAS